MEDDDAPDVDAALVQLARERGASLITTDHDLAKVAQALSVPVPSLNDLAVAFRLPVGRRRAHAELVKEGRERGQAVGYLEDGTMVVAESATEHVGEEVGIVVRNVTKTTTGRMDFASLSSSALR